MIRKLAAIASLALLAVFALPAQAHVGVSIGVGIPWPGYYYPHPYYPYAYPYYPSYPYAAPVVVQPSPPVIVQPQATPYVERAPVAQTGPGDDSWFYCEKDKAYYPYVKQCAAGWVRVPARPAQ